MLKNMMLLACFFAGIQVLHAQSLGSFVNTAKNAASQAVGSAKAMYKLHSLVRNLLQLNN